MTDLRTTDRPILATEYAVAATGLWSRTAWRTLPWAFDDVTQDFGDDLYERMLLDPQVVAVLNILRAAIIEEGVRLDSAVKDETADGYDLANEIEEFCESVIGDLQISIDDVLWDMLSAVAFGSRMAEQVYQDRPATAYALPGTSPVSRTGQMLTLAALKPKPRRSVAFVVDAFMNVQAIQAQLPGTGWMGLGTWDAQSAASWPGVLPRHKFAVLSFRPESSDPRGTSAFRPAYTPWWTKMQVWQEFLKYLATFASPSVYAIASEKASNNGVKDSDGTIKPATQVLLQTLLDFKNGTAAAFDYGTILGALEVQNDGAPFRDALTLCDQQITIAVLHQTLATLEAQHQARASSEVHQDVLDTLQRQAKRSVARMLHRDVLMPLVRYNYGEDAAKRLTPSVSLGEVEQHDFAAMANAIAALAKAGYLDPSQYAEVDTQLGLPPRADVPEQAAAVPEPETGVADAVGNE